MLCSTRHGYARTVLGAGSILPTSLHPTYHIPPIPHAESSRAAAARADQVARQLRSFSSPTFLAKGKARSEPFTRSYSSAAALRKDQEADDSRSDIVSLDGLEEDGPWPDFEQKSGETIRWSLKETEDRLALLEQSRRDSHARRHPSPSDLSLSDLYDKYGSSSRRTLRPPAAEVNPLHPFPSAAVPDSRTWRRLFLELVLSDPLIAFLSLHTVDEAAFACMAAEDFDQLFKQMARLHEVIPNFEKCISRGDAGIILVRLKEHLLSLGPVDRQRQGYVPGPRLRGRRLDEFLRLCVWFRCFDLAKTTFITIFPAHIRKSISTTKDVQQYSRFLVHEQRWNLLAASLVHQRFPAESPNLPVSQWTAPLVCDMMAAYLALRLPSAVPHLYDRYRHRKGRMSARIFQLTIQAMVQMGRLEEAKRVRIEAKDNGFTEKDYVQREKLAIVRGQRSLGFDSALEGRILKELETHRPQPTAEFLHTLVKLRMDNHDIEGARRLMGWFDMEIWDDVPSRKSGVAPTNQTLELAFNIIARYPDIEQLSRWWGHIQSNGVFLHGRVLPNLVRALCQLGKDQDAYNMIANHLHTRYGVIDDEATVKSTWTLPIGTPLRMETFNALLRGMADRYGLVGIKRTADLMREADEVADERTLEIILKSVRQHMSADPAELAHLLKSMLKRAGDLQAEIGHIDTILAEAVKRAAEDHAAFLAPEAHGELSDPAVGLLPVGAFAEAVDEVLESLRERDIPSNSASIANRLRFEAASSSAREGLPTAKRVWNELIAKGYKPSNKHLVALMKGYADAGQMGEAANVLNLARQTGNPITRSMYMVLLAGWFEQGKIGNAEKVYNSIKAGSPYDPDQGLDIKAISTMIRGYYRNRKYTEAMQVVQNDLLVRPGRFDDRVITTAMTALRWAGEDAMAIEVLETRRENQGLKLNYIFRRIVQRIRTHAERRAEQLRPNADDSALLGRIRRILEQDDEARPYLAEDSGVLRPSSDRIPDPFRPDDIRAPLSQAERQDLAILFDLDATPTELDTLAQVKPTEKAERVQRENDPLMQLEQAEKAERAKVRREAMREENLRRIEAEATGNWLHSTSYLRDGGRDGGEGSAGDGEQHGEKNYH